jgi:hypothetical protein
MWALRSHVAVIETIGRDAPVLQPATFPSAPGSKTAYEPTWMFVRSELCAGEAFSISAEMAALANHAGDSLAAHHLTWDAPELSDTFTSDHFSPLPVAGSLWFDEPLELDGTGLLNDGLFWSQRSRRDNDVIVLSSFWMLIRAAGSPNRYGPSINYIWLSERDGEPDTLRVRLEGDTNHTRWEKSRPLSADEFRSDERLRPIRFLWSMRALVASDSVATATTQTAAPRAFARQIARSGLAPTVRVVDLPRRTRGADSETHGDRTRNAPRAHSVAGHWRLQPYGPGRSLRRPVWVLPHVRGVGELHDTAVVYRVR